MDTKKLRQKILDLAIHGKLVPQDPNDEPASVLLERIHAEKEALIKEGKIKRTKKTIASDTSHYENVPFEVPEGWCWCRLDEVADVARGGSPRPIKQYLTDSPDGVNWIKIGDTTEGSKYIEKTVEKIIPEGVRHSRMVKEGDFLLTNSMSFGKPFILKTNGCIHDGWLVISPFEGSFDKDYLYYLLSSGFAYDQFSDKASGAVVSNLNKDKVAESLFPLPPFEEQKKIVCQIESIMNFIDRMENNLEDVFTLVDRCKSRILNLAIHGKLVQQDANDEPASELLKRINPKAIASCDNPHYEQVSFEIPSNWSWATLGDITNYGKCSTVPVDDIDEESWVLELEDIEKDSAKVIKLCTKSDRAIKGVRHSFLQGYVLYSKLRTYLNKVLVANKDGFCTTEIIPIKCSNSIYPEYLCHVLRSKYFLDYTAQCGYGVKMPRLSTTDARKALVPLPPYEEQIKISAIIKELYCSLDSIAETLA